MYWELHPVALPRVAPRLREAIAGSQAIGKSASPRLGLALGGSGSTQTLAGNGREEY